MRLPEGMRHPIKWTQSTGEEMANSISHGAGLLAAIIGAPILLAAASERGSPYFLAGAIVYAATMLLLYLGSTLYHAWPQTSFKCVLQVVDHSAIFLLIAGTYTPFALGPLRGPWGWTVLAGGVGVCDFRCLHESDERRAASPALLALPLSRDGLAGAACYAAARAGSADVHDRVAHGSAASSTRAGIIFFVREHVRYSHFVWHLFVLGGTLCHYVAVLTYATA